MTDWWAKCNDEGKPGDRTNTAAMVRAQNDLYMVTANAGENSAGDNSAAALEAGTLTRQELLRCAANICGFLLHSPALLRLLGRETELDKALAESPSFDDGAASEMYYTEVNEQNEIDFDVSLIGLEKGQNTRFGASVKERGMYALELTLRSTDQNDVSQLPISVFQDRNLLGTITLTGAQREWETFTLKVPSFSGNFYLRFFAAQTGLAMKSCKLKLEQSFEELMKARQ